MEGNARPLLGRGLKKDGTFWGWHAGFYEDTP